jgi:hypothetical protein
LSTANLNILRILFFIYTFVYSRLIVAINFGVVLAHKPNLLLQSACEAGILPYMSKRKSFAEATDNLLSAFTNIWVDSVNRQKVLGKNKALTSSLP